ncbi:polysaccharide deacetylase family protein [Clostridium saccharobutylicum]|uniref:Poly-beta-1,6-N-acetyl-D-glucosamine N-deacetylase n=1 Tax=Clostridium saccharobutylicum TaxID=169679 RepID=A0A1S8N4M0_CLOSA|nr:polysaccharide deacetylase family protein [Clostridium saccharobutylicum]OOM11352.1 poly-beta-1,6-N-acetyl-D-glucosamine N-deacetylase precursor [Clostridium saccharobutylicum]
MLKKYNFKNKSLLIFIATFLVCVLSGYSIYKNILPKGESKNISKALDEYESGNDSKINTSNIEKKRTFDESTLTNDNIGVPVLYYHSVRDSNHNEVTISPQKLKNELKYLKDQGYVTLTLRELSDYLLNNSPIPEKSIVVTFDDGYMDNYQNAFPILKELDMKATIFCITSDLDGEYYLSKDAIKEMSNYGIDIQSHTVNHSELNKLSYDEQLKQLKESKKTLESITGKSVFSIAYPYGKYNEDSIKAAKAAGYSLAFTTDRGLADRDDSPLKLNRIYINSNYTIATFKQILATTKK